MPSVAGDAARRTARKTSAARVPAVRPVSVKRAAATIRVGVLSLQGDHAKHGETLRAVGAEAVRISLPEHLEGLDAMILPGGESSTMLRLLDATGLREGVQEFVRTRPVLGTCAGLILLAKQADRLPTPTLGAIDISAMRNAYGRQVHSFTDPVDMPELTGGVLGVFIRAPRITRMGKGVQVIATHAGEPVGVRQGKAVALTFHPELTDDARVHAWFLREIAGLTVRGVRG